MKRESFNGGWIFYTKENPEEKTAVRLPHDAMQYEERIPKLKNGPLVAFYPGGDYYYEKDFYGDPFYEGRTVMLDFGGIFMDSHVYLNGEEMGGHVYGYSNFYVDLTDKLRIGEKNLLKVYVHNSQTPNSRWYSGTGLYRPVWMYVGEENYILVNGVKIRTISRDPAVVEVEVKTFGSGMVRVEILDGEKTILTEEKEAADQSTVFQFTVPEAKLWSCEKPSLYLCRVTFGGDTVTETFGIRTLAWDTEKGLTINGERVILRGACIHHDNGIVGACAFPEAEERKVKVLKESGYNALRSAHNPCSKAILDACDRLGMLMMDEYVDVWYIHKTEHDYAGTLMEWWKDDLRDMVNKDYNHPCVIMYSTGNEVAETSEKKGIDFAGKMTEYLHRLDSGRPVTCGINIFFNFLYSMGMGVYSDEKAEKNSREAQERVERTDSRKKEISGRKKKKSVGSEFYNRLACMVGDYFMKIGATLPPCDWKTKDAFANMDIAGYNYGLFRYKHDLKKYPNRLILGSETFCKDAYAFWKIAKKNPRIIGDFVWAGMDYIGEIGEGAAEYEDYRSDDPADGMTGGNGRVDLIGNPRAEAAYTRVAFERAAGPFIAVKPPYQKEKLRLTGWQLTKGIESWSWRGSAGEMTDVEVFARGSFVELSVNGKSVGRKKIKNCRACFRIPYEDGEITAVSCDENGHEIGKQTLKTAGDETVLNVIPEQESLSRDGIGFLRLKYTDADGIW